MARAEKRKRIVIASLLKPIDDARMFEKIGVTLAASPDCEVHVIGFPVTMPSQHPNVSFHPLKRFTRLRAGRILARIEAMIKMIRLKPDVFVATTHELLGAAVVAKIYLRSRVVYDVQENYFRNLIYGNTLPWGLRHILAAMIRIKEIMTSPFVNHFILAERCYENELGFVRKKYSVIENLARRPLMSRPRRGTTRLTFTGTLAESTGVFKAIDLATGLHRINPNITLTITGYAPDDQTFQRIKHEIETKPFITLIGGSELINHDLILHEIEKADFGIVSYIVNKATHDRIPTKVYEYLANQLPILLINHSPWVDMVSPFQAAILFDDQSDPGELLQQMNSGRFYIHRPNGVFWEGQEQVLLSAVLGGKS